MQTNHWHAFEYAMKIYAGLWLFPTLLQAAEIEFRHDESAAGSKQSARRDEMHYEQQATHVFADVIARKDHLEKIYDGTRLNAALGYPISLSDGKLSLGGGINYQRTEAPSTLSAETALHPAGLLCFRNSIGYFKSLISSQFGQAELSYLTKWLLPVELHALLEYQSYLPIQFISEVFVFLGSQVGLLGGYEISGARTRLGVWVSPIENLQLKLLFRISEESTSRIEFSVRSIIGEVQPSAPVNDSRSAPSELPTKNVSPKSIHPPQSVDHLKKTVPQFAILVRWGLTPSEALALSRDHDICKLGSVAQNKLAQHNWRCRP